MNTISEQENEIIDDNNKMMKSSLMCLVILVVLFFLIVAFVSLLNKDAGECREMSHRTNFDISRGLVVLVTLYHPTIEECGWDKNITSTGDTGHIGGCAVTQKMLNYFVNYGDTIEVMVGVLSGKYVVNDRAGGKGLLVDVWRPVGDSLAGCYKSIININ